MKKTIIHSFIHSIVGRWHTHPENVNQAYFYKGAWNEVCLFNMGSSFSPGQRNGASLFSVFKKSGTNIPRCGLSHLSSLLMNPRFIITILKWNVSQRCGSIVTIPGQTRFLSKSKQAKWCWSPSSISKEWSINMSNLSKYIYVRLLDHIWWKRPGYFSLKNTDKMLT